MDFPLDVTNIVIETERLTLRAFTQADLQDFYNYASIPGVGEMAGWPHHESIETSRTILQMFLNNKDVFALYHKADKKVIGSLGLHNAWINREEEYKHLKAKNIGYVLSKDYWGMGLVPEAVNAVINYGFTTLEMEAFSIEHFVENMQSRRVIEKCGFKFVKKGRFHAKLLDKHFDELRYVLLKSEGICQFFTSQELATHYISRERLLMPHRQTSFQYRKLLTTTKPITMIA